MSALLAYQIDQHIKELATLIHQAPDPGGAAAWCLRELGARAGLRVLVLDRHAAPSERLIQAGAEVLDALREGLAVDADVDATRDEARALMSQLTEELVAYDQGDDYDGMGGLEREWGTTVVL